MEWLHPGCDSDSSADFLNFGANNFPLEIPFKKCFKIVFLSLWRRDPVLELQFPTPLHVVLLCFATQSLQIALYWLRQGLLGAAAACVILLSFAAEDRKSYWSGCTQAAIAIRQQIFSYFGANNFPLEIPLKKCFKIVFLEGNLESQNLRIDIGFEEMAALKHSLKIALHVYNALQNSLCFACRRSIPIEERRNIGLGYFKYGLCAGCFEALTTVCTEQDDTLAEQRCVALTDDGVHAAAMLLSAYRAGAGCRFVRKQMQLGSAMSLRIVRTSCLICFVKCHETANQASNVISSPAFRASAGRKAAKSLDDQV